jgi:hypothetical protein
LLAQQFVKHSLRSSSFFPKVWVHFLDTSF